MAPNTKMSKMFESVFVCMHECMEWNNKQVKVHIFCTTFRGIKIYINHTLMAVMSYILKGIRARL